MTTKDMNLKQSVVHIPAGRMIRSVIAALLAGVVVLPLSAASVEERHYGHETVHDEHGVIVPWYHGLNGQCDYRVRIAAETLKRYPSTTFTNAIAEYPAYVFSGHRNIAADGTITPLAEPEESAAAAHYLASPESAFITRLAKAVDGGNSAGR